MGDINEIKFSGIIERLKSVNTKTGTSMATLLLKVGQDRFKVVGFKNIADAILKCSDGDEISVTGSGSINSWKDKEEHWHNDFQLSVWEAAIDGRIFKYEKNTGDDSQANNSRDEPPLPPEPKERDPGAAYQHRGGPF